jgi:uncharacterized membrane protein YeaQ/YmgE (transglycosylase-associated protein family)
LGINHNESVHTKVRIIRLKIREDLACQNEKRPGPKNQWVLADQGTNKQRTPIMFAQFVLEPGGFISWLFVGLLAGWITGIIMRGKGYGIIRDTILGLIGSLIGGCVFSFFYQGSAGFWGSVGVAAVGAIILVIIVRAVSRSSR